MAEAGAVCLETQKHANGVSLLVRGDLANVHTLRWPVVTQQMRRAWADLLEATEWGAAGIALLVTLKEFGLSAVERALIGTHVDYWLGEQSDAPHFQRKARLEVSGVLHDTDAVVRARLRTKRDRLDDSPGALPVWIVIVEFSRPLAEVGGP